MSAFTVKSYINTVVRDLEKAEEKALDRGATYLRAQLKKEVSKKSVSSPGNPPGMRTGDLRKGIAFTREPGKRFVGFKRPASHAHILEFGTGPRTVKNWMGTGKPKDVGPLAARPFFVPTWEREQDNVEMLLGGPWL
jgi:hypothetical protein